MANRPFNRAANLVCPVPVIRIPYRTGIQAKISFRIDVDHTSGLRRCAGILTVADTMIFSVLAFVPGHLWVDEFECWNTETQMGSVPLRFHGELWVIRTTRDTGTIDCIICLLWICSGIKGNESSGEMAILTKGVTGEKCLVGIHCVESGIAKEYFGLYQRMLPEKIFQSRKQ